MDPTSHWVLAESSEMRKHPSRAWQREHTLSLRVLVPLLAYTGKVVAFLDRAQGSL